MRTLTFLGLTTAAAAMSLLVGCSQKLTQKEVNQQRESAHLAVADASKSAASLGREARNEIADVDRPRVMKVAELQTALESKPAADAPQLEAQIDQTNRDADNKIVKIQEKKLAQQDSIIRSANEKTDKAEHTAAAYESQTMQKAFVEPHAHQLANLDISIMELKKHRDNLGGDARTIFDRRMQTLQVKRSAAGVALNNLKAATPELWTTFRDEVKQSFSELKAAYDEAAQQPAVDASGSTP